MCVSIVFRIEEILGDAKSRVPFFVPMRALQLSEKTFGKFTKN